MSRAGGDDPQGAQTRQRYQPYQPKQQFGFGQNERRGPARRVVDHGAAVERGLQPRARTFAHDPWDPPLHQPTRGAALEVQHAAAYAGCPSNAYNLRLVHTTVTKARAAVNALLWSPDGTGRLLSGSNAGEFQLWHGATFGYEAAMQSHESVAIRSMTWSHDEDWLVSGDDGGTIKYSKTTLNIVKDIRSAHKEAVTGLSFAPSDVKFVSGSDDTTVKIWDFANATLETVLAGHGGDVKGVAWHPSRALIASASKDNTCKLWDAQGGAAVATLHGHKQPVLFARWHAGGQLLLTGGKDFVCKVFDVRMLAELGTYRGHERDVTAAAWHPQLSGTFASCGVDGAVLFWDTAAAEPQAALYSAHDAAVLSMAWHPMGHLLATGGADSCIKFWGRLRPGCGLLPRETAKPEATAGGAGGTLALPAASRGGGGGRRGGRGDSRSRQQQQQRY